MESKVFCKDCKNYKSYKFAWPYCADDWEVSHIEDCKAENIDCVTGKETGYGNNPRVVNKNCDCKLFQPGQPDINDNVDWSIRDKIQKEMEERQKEYLTNKKWWQFWK